MDGVGGAVSLGELAELTVSNDGELGCDVSVPKMSPKCPQSVPKMSPKCPQSVPKVSSVHPQRVPYVSPLCPIPIAVCPLTSSVPPVPPAPFMSTPDLSCPPRAPSPIYDLLCPQPHFSLSPHAPNPIYDTPDLRCAPSPIYEHP